MDDNKVKYYPYEDYSEGVEKMPEDYDDGGYDDGGAKKDSNKSVKTLIGVLVAVLLVFVILLGVFVAMKKKGQNKPANSGNVVTASDAIQATTAEAVTTEADLYPVGDYVVSAEGSLRLREDHSTDAKHIMSVPSGTKLTISEVYIDENAAAKEEKFWGKTDYKGWTAWVAMAYLTKAAGGAEVTTLEGESGIAGVTLPGETTTKSAAVAKFEPGKYVVTADEFLRVREDHDVDSEALTQIDRDEEITILEVYHDTDAEDDTLEYWGKVSYDEYVGWVAMHYTEPVA